MSRKISELLSGMDTGGSVSAELLDMLQEGSSLQAILDYTWEAVKNPVMLVDVTFNYEASSGTDSLDDEPVWEYTIKNGFMPNYYLNYIAGIENQELNDDMLVEIAGNILNHDQYTVRILQSGRLMGYLMLLQRDTEVTGQDRAFLRLISGFLSIRMSAQIRSDDFRFSVIENFLTSILRNKITSPEEINSRQELFGIRLYEVMHVITIEMTDFRTSDDRKYNLLRKVRKLFDRNNVIQLNDYIIVLYDTKSLEEAFSEELLEDLRSILQKYHCVANISYPFRSLVKFYEHYMQTVYCMELRRVLDLGEPLVRYQDVIHFHMLMNFSEQTDLEFLLHDSIRELQKADRDNDSDYTNTLFTYVNCQQNISKAAERMQLHYNTLKYRINRIIAMTGIDLNDEDTVFSVMISQRILRIREMMIKPSRMSGFDDGEWIMHANPPGSRN